MPNRPLVKKIQKTLTKLTKSELLFTKLCTSHVMTTDDILIMFHIMTNNTRNIFKNWDHVRNLSPPSLFLSSRNTKQDTVPRPWEHPIWRSSFYLLHVGTIRGEILDHWHPMTPRLFGVRLGVGIAAVVRTTMDHSAQIPGSFQGTVKHRWNK